MQNDFIDIRDYGNTGRVYPYAFVFLHRYWGNHTIVPVPVKWYRIIGVTRKHESTKYYFITKACNQRLSLRIIIYILHFVTWIKQHKPHTIIQRSPWTYCNNVVDPRLANHSLKLQWRVT